MLPQLHKPGANIFFGIYKLLSGFYSNLWIPCNMRKCTNNPTAVAKKSFFLLLGIIPIKHIKHFEQYFVSHRFILLQENLYNLTFFFVGKEMFQKDLNFSE